MDSQAVDDVVTNLLSNAWNYKRGNRARIAVRTACRARWAEIVVEDDGIGIPRAERRKVFDMFYRADQFLSQPVAGTGLGLSLVRSAVSGHRGRIRIETGEGGVGTRFRLRFPLDRRAPPPPAASPPAHGNVETRAAKDEPVRVRAANPGETR
jgi:signal transduction histidine kinase